MKRITTALAASLLLATATAQAQSQIAKVGTGCHLEGYRGPLRCLTLSLPADYSEAKGKQLDVFVAIAPSLREQAKPDPLFVLAGGPGQAGSSLIATLNTAFSKLRTTRDIVFIDQRGTGRSGKLDCPALKDSMLSFDEAKLFASFENCVSTFTQDEQIDLSDYNTLNAARDLDQIRQALGYSQINLWGGSYGTRLAQAYARAFPAATRALIIDGVVSPEQVLGFWSQDAQAALERLFTQCSEDPACHEAFPELETKFEQARRSMKASVDPVRLPHPRTGAITEIPLSYELFADAIRTALYAPQTMAFLPELIYEASAGNWEPLVTFTLNFSEWSQDAMAVLLTFAVVCAEDMPYANAAMLAEEQATGFLEGLHARNWPRLCKFLPVTPQPRPDTATIEAPSLLLSGQFDPVTPASRAEQAMVHLQQAQHILVPLLSHGISHIGCAPSLMRSFLDAPQQQLDAECLLETRFAPFVVNAAGPPP